MKLSYDNPWVKLNPDGSNPLQTRWSGVKFEYLNLLTEKLIDIDWYRIDRFGKVNYRKNSVTYIINQNHFRIRYKSNLYEKIVRNFNAIEVGDFVKCKSRSNDWRKILEIDEKHMTITGRGAWDPNDENLKDTMSTNGIITITKIVKG